MIGKVKQEISATIINIQSIFEKSSQCNETGKWIKICIKNKKNIICY